MSNFRIGFKTVQEEVEKLGLELTCTQKPGDSLLSSYVISDNGKELFRCESVISSRQAEVILGWCNGYQHQIKEAYLI